MKKLLLLTMLAPLICVTVTGQTIDAASRTIYGATTSITYASHISGVKLDCVPSTGLTAAGGVCTDNTSAINAVLSTATSAHPVHLIMDGGSFINGIVGPAAGYWSIDCLNTSNGFFMGPTATGDQPMIASSGYHSMGTPGTPGHAIAIRNCFLNGNRSNNTNAVTGIYLDNMVNVRLENNWYYNMPYFNLLLNACADCESRGERFDDSTNSGGEFSDGIHIDGPSSQIRIIDPWFWTNDDSIALNASEGYSGNITDVSITGARCYMCLTALRILSNEDGQGQNDIVSNVTFTNGSGTIYSTSQNTGRAFLLGNIHSNTANLDLIGPVHISNSAYTILGSTSSFMAIEDNVGEVSLNNVVWTAPSGAQPWLAFLQAATISSFTCNVCKIYRNTTGNSAAWFATVPAGSTIKRMELGLSVENETGQPYSPLSYLMDVQSGGAIGTLVLDSVDPALSPILLNGNEWARVTNFYGPGVPAYFRNTTYANLPPATYPGLKASISDSNAGGVWGAAEGGGSAGHYAEETSNGTNWTVTGK